MGVWYVHLAPASNRAATVDHGKWIVEQLSATRRIRGDHPLWLVPVECARRIDAIAVVETELRRLDPGWRRVLRIS